MSAGPLSVSTGRANPAGAHQATPGPRTPRQDLTRPPAFSPYAVPTDLSYPVANLAGHVMTVRRLIGYRIGGISGLQFGGGEVMGYS